MRYRLPDGFIIDICRDVRNAENDYLIDRGMQRAQNYTGIHVIRGRLGHGAVPFPVAVATPPRRNRARAFQRTRLPPCRSDSVFAA
jgi:hypothetical protein